MARGPEVNISSAVPLLSACSQTLTESSTTGTYHKQLSFSLQKHLQLNTTEKPVHSEGHSKE